MDVIHKAGSGVLLRDALMASASPSGKGGPGLAGPSAHATDLVNYPTAKGF